MCDSHFKCQILSHGHVLYWDKARVVSSWQQSFYQVSIFSPPFSNYWLRPGIGTLECWPGSPCVICQMIYGWVLQHLKLTGDSSWAAPARSAVTACFLQLLAQYKSCHSPLAQLNKMLIEVGPLACGLCGGNNSKLHAVPSFDGYSRASWYYSSTEHCELVPTYTHKYFKVFPLFPISKTFPLLNRI